MERNETILMQDKNLSLAHSMGSVMSQQPVPNDMSKFQNKIQINKQSVHLDTEGSPKLKHLSMDQVESSRQKRLSKNNPITIKDFKNLVPSSDVSTLPEKSNIAQPQPSIDSGKVSLKMSARNRHSKEYQALKVTQYDLANELQKTQQDKLDAPSISTLDF